jgi:large subunit ribosomal protein L15
MNELSKLKKPAGSTHRRKRVGRGQASGLGKTAGRGAKGQKARTGNMHFEGFEGGQSPLQRRIPKRGFTNIHRDAFAVVNLEALAELPAGTTVDGAALVKLGLLKDVGQRVKILGDGELKGALTVHAHAFSASAKSKIEAAGGKAEAIVKTPAASA